MAFAGRLLFTLIGLFAIENSAWAISPSDVIQSNQALTYVASSTNKTGTTAVVSNYFESMGSMSLSVRESKVNSTLIDWFDLLIMNPNQERKQIYIKLGMGIEEKKYEGKLIATPDGLVYNGVLPGGVPILMVFINHEVGESLRTINELRGRFGENVAETTPRKTKKILGSFIPEARADILGDVLTSQVSQMLFVGDSAFQSTFLPLCKTCLVSAIKGAVGGIIGQAKDVWSLGKGIVNAVRFTATPTSFTQKLKKIGTAIGDGIHDLKKDFMNVVSKVAGLNGQTMAKLFCGLIAEMLTPVAIDSLLGGTLTAYLAGKVVLVVKRLAREYNLLEKGFENIAIVRDMAHAKMSATIGNDILSKAAVVSGKVNELSDKFGEPVHAVTDHVEDAADGAN